MRHLKTIFITLAFAALPLAAQSGQELSADEMRTLFTGKTFNGENLKSGWTFDNYASAEGECIVRYTSGKKSGQTMNNKWYIEDGLHCCETPKKKVCGTISDEGDGVYHKKNKSGKHIQTFRNFVEGNQLQ